jgi:lipoprotein-anchoring transpeptidase ErfK/SrfK
MRTYDIAIGQRGYRTPPGIYVINTKARCPDWWVPDSPWAWESGLEPGTTVPGCTPENPIKSRWLGVTDPKDGVGIHGTDAEWSIGTRASHGCIRMRVPDVEELFELVPKGTLIEIR